MIATLAEKIKYLTSVDTDDRKVDIPAQLFYKSAVILIGFCCVVPSLLNLLGFSFSLENLFIQPDQLVGLTPTQTSELLHTALHGSFLHTVLEWTAVMIAIVSAILAFSQFLIKGDIVTPTVGIALLCSAIIDALHILASDHLISSNTPIIYFIPFTWAVCRIFNALVMIGGVSYFIFVNAEKIKPENRVRRLVEFAFILGFISVALMLFITNSSSLPSTIFPDQIVTRPYDLIALALYGLLGTVFYPWLFRKYPNSFTQTLFLSAIPAVMAQVHMTFGSGALFDNHFFIGHFFKVVAYLVPFGGLVFEFVRTFKHETVLKNELNTLNMQLEKKIEEGTDTILKQRQALEYTAKMSSLGLMAGGIAHEINTPLATMQICSETLDEMASKQVLDFDKFFHLTTKLRSMVTRIAKIVISLRTFARDGTSDPLETESLQKIVQETLIFCEQKAENSHVRLEFSPNDQNTQIECRPTEVYKVILSLVNNAFDAIEDQKDKWIKVEVLEKPDAVEVSVTDSGSGISNDLIEKIMQPFFTTKEIGKGTGLGLSISRGIVESHHGELYVDQTSPNTRFVAVFPKKQI